MKKLIYLFIFLLISGFYSGINAQNVSVNPGAGSYATLKDAFDAINAGTHSGAITVDILFGTVETATAALNYSGNGAASYTSVTVTTSNAAGVTVEGFLNAAAVIRLIGADNVTIDGRVGGTGRFISVRNNGNGLNAIGIWLSNGPSATDTAGAKHNVIRNCEISCNLRVDSSTSATYGILAGSSTIGNSAGRNNDSNQYLENRIVKCRYGILLHGGAATNRSDNNVIMGNIIGPDVSGPDNIGKVGIYAQFQDFCIISENTVNNVGGTFVGTTGGADRVGIGVGSESWSSTPTTTTGGNYTVTKNKVSNIKEERTFSAVGILVGTTRSAADRTNNVIVNNEIANVITNGTAGDAAIGIGHNGNRSGDLIAYNSIYMSGDCDPPGGSVDATQTACGIRVAVVVDSITTVKNNSIYVDLTSNNAAVLNCCIQMPIATYVFNGATLDHNDYYFPSGNLQMKTGALGTTSAPTVFFTTLTDWQSAGFVPSQDANSISGDPLYALTQPYYLIPLNISSPLLLEADPIPGITSDILGEIRSAFTPTIGAYEFDSTTLPVELASLSASVSGQDVTLNWTTTAELNNAGFDIERKISSEAGWTKIGFTEGSGTTNNTTDYSFTDRNLSTGRYNYRLKQIDYNGNFEYYNLSGDVSIGVPSRFDLSQNYPNPFNPSTKINFDLPQDSKVSIKLFDMSGREVMTLVNDVRPAGYYAITFNAANLSSGAYFYRIQAGSFAETKKMILVK